MRWVERGPEPAGVAYYSREYTQLWVRFFREGIGGRPREHDYWRLFTRDLRERFSNKCGYCERQCEQVGDLSPSVDHFRPLNSFPELAYEWDNWIFSCQRCNNDKANKWLEPGYVDPCALDMAERPEEYFDYIPRTAEIVPKSGLTPEAHLKAERTIDDLGLNKIDLLASRFDHISEFIEELYSQSSDSKKATVVSAYMEPSQRHVGVVRMMVWQLRQAGIIQPLP